MNTVNPMINQFIFDGFNILPGYFSPNLTSDFLSIQFTLLMSRRKYAYIIMESYLSDNSNIMYYKYTNYLFNIYELE